MSAPQPPWSPGQPPADQPGPAQGNGAPQGYGSPQGYRAPQNQSESQGYVPQGYVPQGYGAPQTRQPYGGGPTGELVINLRKPFGAMGMIAPVVMIDGYPARSSWGRNSFQAPAGLRQVDVAQSYLVRTYGRASLPVTVEAGRTSEIFYSGPMTTVGSAGAIGREPQQRPGARVFIGLMVFLFVLLLIVVAAVALGNS